MTAGIKANPDGSGAIQVNGSDFITIGTSGAVAIPQTLAVTGAATLPTIRSSTSNTPPTIQDSAGTQIGTFCRAWVNFNGTTNVGGFCTIRGSFNVTTVADNGTGDYTINFTTAMPDANYSVNTTSRRSSSTDAQGIATVYPNVTYGNAIATTFVRVVTGASSSGSFSDYDFVAVSVFR